MSVSSQVKSSQRSRPEASLLPSPTAAELGPSGAGPGRLQLAATRPPGPPLPLPVVGADLEVPLVTGGTARYVHLDSAASAPCLAAVAEAVAAHLPWYSSVHRGAGFTSAVTTAAYDEARATVGRFVGARAGDAVVFTRNTTDALNLLAAALPEGATVIAFASEHHANLLPWRRRRHLLLPVPATVDEALDRAEAALRRAGAGPTLLTVTGASNVTGELWPVAALGRLARHYGARLCVDAAQLAPHRAIDLEALGADYLALSGHKLYAPLGSGALVGRRDWLDAASPYLAGGGAVRRVSLDDAGGDVGGGAEWAEGPARHEAGTPNVLGAVALAAACRTLAATGMEAVAAHEQALLERLDRGLRALPGVEVLSIFGPDHPRIGVAAFRARGWHHAELAAALGAEHGIGVRDGAFCAHPLLDALAARGGWSEAAPRWARGASDPKASGPSFGPCSAVAAGPPGAVRASLGAGSRGEDVDRLIAALEQLLSAGPRWRYAVDGGRLVPSPDPRALPAL